ncbi:MAG: hydantoinase/oxoprolinase family protein [bacterium]|jgi:N-methylhydantoinase A/oxoprolinase/acetone carboxylase beta subunit|nr:hydantoinase/oxoprolinase family protein [Betaproteobacteria bacterium]
MTQTRPPLPRHEVGVDIGGTFTDVVCRSDTGEVRLVKIPTTRANPSAGVLHAVQHMAREWNVPPASIARFVHGTTVATNAVLERKGATIGIITTLGFRDTLEIGRQNRHAVYSVLLEPETPVFLAPGALRREVAGRISADGTELTALDEDAVRREVDALVAAGVRAIAVCFLFSYLNPSHELRAAEIIRAAHPSLMVSLSCEVDPAFREYERTCITAFDAYLKPVIDRYLEDMERDLESSGVGSKLQIMQSRGGVASSRIARRRPVRLFLSGPAAGVIGGSMAGSAAGFDDVITIDIGGTSADIALVSGGRPMIAAEGMLDGYAVRVPMVDVNAIGAGGGSIAWIDGAKSLRVGPASAGSEPGPACYARGGEQPTVTDASIVLGYLDPSYFAGGSFELQPELSRQAIERRIAIPLGLTVEQAALGIHRVVNANMAEGIRFVSVKRGIDPRRFGLVPLGGGGPVHATALARDLGMQKVIVPLHPGVLSASGLLAAPVEHEAAVAFHSNLEQATTEDLARAFAALDRQCAALMQVENIDPARVEVRYFADVCYVGQSHHIEVPVSMQHAAGEPADVIARVRAGFHEAHDRIYGHSAGGPMTFVNLRAVHQARVTDDRPLEGTYRPEAGDALKGRRPIMTERSGGFVQADVYERSRIVPGTSIAGPAIIEQADTTTVIEPGWTAQVDVGGNLVMTQGEPA